MTERPWQQWRHKVESGGVVYSSASLLISELRNAYLQDSSTRAFFDAMAWNEELTVHGVGGHGSTLVIIPILDVRARR